MVIKRTTGPENVLAQIKEVRSLKRAGAELYSSLQESEQILCNLLKGQMELQGLMPWSSNYTFLVSLKQTKEQSNLLGIYKPCQGERPLWDFPDQTLCQREFASYLVSQALGWPNIPTTVLRDGPHGPG